MSSWVIVASGFDLGSDRQGVVHETILNEANYRGGVPAGDAAGAGDAAPVGAASVVEIVSFNGDFLRTCRSVLVNDFDVAATRAGGGGTSWRRASSSRARRRISAAPAAFPRALSQLYAWIKR